MHEIVIDTETTGLDPLDGHRVVEIGAVELVDRAVTGNTFHRYLCPQRAMPAAAVAVYGLTGAFLADKRLFAAVADEFLVFVGDAPLVAHNAGFDIAFLNAELKGAAKPGNCAKIRHLSEPPQGWLGLGTESPEQEQWELDGT
jgi:DNA polymerase-3 subunit epsilon